MALCYAGTPARSAPQGFGAVPDREATTAADPPANHFVPDGSGSKSARGVPP